MTLDVWYWLFMALWVFFGVWRNRADANWAAWGGGLLVEFILFLIVGLRVFGSPIK